MTSPHWLTARRMRFILVVVLLAGTGLTALNALAGWQSRQQPLGYDFLTFWSAWSLALHHHALSAYSFASLTQTAYAEVPHATAPGPWQYPPAFLLMLAPLAHAPFLLALPLFILGGLLLFVLTMRTLLPGPNVLLATLAFPGAWLNIMLGQNGYLSATAAGLGLFWLPRRPVLAGICLGLLAAKPQLAVLFPLLLLITRQWRALLAATATVAVSNGAALWLWGTGLVPAFLATLPNARIYIEQLDRSLVRMSSVTSSARMLGAGLPLAYGLHAAVAVLALAAVIQVWRISQDNDLRACACVAATFLLSPYIYIYDAVWYGLYIGFFIRYAQRLGWRRGEREMLALAFVFAPLCTLLASLTHVGLGPVLSVTLLAMALRRALPGGHALRAPGPQPGRIAAHLR